MSRLQRFAKLPRAEKTLFIKAFFFVGATRAILWLVPFTILQKGLRGFLSPKAKTPETDWTQISKIVRSVRFAGKVVPAATCLTQALAALLLIHSSGQNSELKIGVAKDEKNHFKAHAWLETEGRIIIGKLPGHNDYIVLSKRTR